MGVRSPEDTEKDRVTLLKETRTRTLAVLHLGHKRAPPPAGVRAEQLARLPADALRQMTYMLCASVSSPVTEGGRYPPPHRVVPI